MPASTRIDLHLHSTYSDGRLSPSAVAERVARRGVALAALADHDTLSSQAAFRAALARRGISSISAVELTTWHEQVEIHLLGYGVDIEHAELLDTVAALAQVRDLGHESVSKSLRHRTQGSSVALSCGRLPTRDAIALVHRAGGKTFLAHPLTPRSGWDETRALIAGLRSLGLDGIEALYSRYSEEDQLALLEVAREHGLAVSAGSDFHGGPEDPPVGVDVPAEIWSDLQATLGSGIHSGEGAIPRPSRHSLRRFILRIALPAVLTVLLFVVAIFGFILPKFEAALLERKREMIRELTNSAVTLLEEAHRAELRGELSRPQAQLQAATRIAALRYGAEGKDYFWLQDLTPRIVMHPYRPELVGKDVTDLRDARGARIFVEFAEVVRRRDQGYVDYVWQWNDDPGRLAPKESYVRGFQPWGWVIGTGLYTEDVRREIENLERGLLYGSAGIVLLVALLLLYVVRESLQLEHQRSDAELHLMETTQRYQSLVEASSEGAILLVENRCVYANPVALKLLGRAPRQMQLLQLDDILPEVPANTEARQYIAVGAYDLAQKLDVELRNEEGESVACAATLSPVQLGDRAAVILQLRRSATPNRPQAVTLPGLSEVLVAVRAAADADTVIALCRGIAPIVERSLEIGAKSRHVTRQLSEICDAATCRLLELALAELPAPPCAFCFIGMGSHGRQEQTLFTDQDNAIIFEDGADEERARAWFARLGGRVSTQLDAAGYSFCRGDVMAQNPAWCNPLSVWQRLFRQWIAKAEPQELLELSVFFDLRPVFGDASLVIRLRQDTSRALAENPGFFPHFAQNALLFKPPLRLFGRILAGTAAGEHAGRLDLKDATMPIVSFARLYAMKHSIAATNTFERIDALADAGLLAHSTRDDLAFVHAHLLRVRLEHQASQLSQGLTPDNAIDHHSLHHMEAVLLREAFGQIDVVQQKISREFLDGDQ